MIAISFTFRLLLMWLKLLGERFGEVLFIDYRALLLYFLFSTFLIVGIRAHVENAAESKPYFNSAAFLMKFYKSDKCEHLSLKRLPFPDLVARITNVPEFNHNPIVFKPFCKNPLIIQHIHYMPWVPSLVRVIGSFAKVKNNFPRPINQPKPSLLGSMIIPYQSIIYQKIKAGGLETIVDNVSPSELLSNLSQKNSVWLHTLSIQMPENKGWWIGKDE